MAQSVVVVDADHSVRQSRVRCNPPSQLPIPSSHLDQHLQRSCSLIRPSHHSPDSSQLSHLPSPALPAPRLLRDVSDLGIRNSYAAPVERRELRELLLDVDRQYLRDVHRQSVLHVLLPQPVFVPLPNLAWEDVRLPASLPSTPSPSPPSHLLRLLVPHPPPRLQRRSARAQDPSSLAARPPRDGRRDQLRLLPGSYFARGGL